MVETLEQLGEKRLLQRLSAYLGSSKQIIRTFSEDCAVVDLNEQQYQLFTVDVLVESVHFQREYMPPFFIGRKAFKVNLSDISAMGGAPQYYMVSFGAPGNLPLRFIDEIYDGLQSAAAELDALMVGGNVTSSSVLFIDVLMTGTVKKKTVLMRNKANNGDLIYVTGRLGGSAEGLKLLQHGFRLFGDEKAGVIMPEGERDSRYVREAILNHFDPPDENAIARGLGELRIISSMIDLSDGLASDLLEVCRQSNVGAVIECEQLPIAPSVLHWERKWKLDPLFLALYGGEDYHLLFTAARRHRKKISDYATRVGVDLYCIGKIVEASEGVLASTREGKRIPLSEGFEHFVTPA